MILFSHLQRMVEGQDVERTMSMVNGECAPVAVPTPTMGGRSANHEVRVRRSLPPFDATSMVVRSGGRLGLAPIRLAAQLCMTARICPHRNRPVAVRGSVVDLGVGLAVCQPLQARPHGWASR